MKVHMLKTRHRIVQDWNQRHPSTPYEADFWPGARMAQIAPQRGTVYTEAMLLGGHTPVVYIRGHGAMALTHVEPLPADSTPRSSHSLG